jgi:carbohydrate-selective porin OprB
MYKKIIIYLNLILFVISLESLSYASEAEVIMNMLLKKGIITQAEYDEVMKELSKTEPLKKRVEAVEKHVDKHITHAEGPAFADGLNIAGGITIVGQGTSGNDDNAAQGEDVIDGNISADLEISSKLGENGELFIALEAGDGTGFTEELDTYWGFNADAGPDTTFDMTEAWYEHQFAGGMYTFTIGELDLTNYFDGNEVANDETTQFLADGFINDITVEFPAGPGVRLTISPVEILDISLGAQSDGWEDMDKKNFLIAEADIKPKIGGRQGNYRFYLWTNRGDHTDANDSTKTKENGSGFGISVDQQVLDFLTLFARLGIRDDDLTEYEFDTAWSGGLALSGSLWGRDNDLLGVAYGQAILSDNQENALRAGGTNPGNEGHFETYYSLVINEHVTVSPDIQAVTNAKGDDDFETVVIGAVRGQFTF